MHKDIAAAYAADKARRAAIAKGPQAALRYHVTGAIERGEAEAIEGHPTCRWEDDGGAAK